MATKIVIVTPAFGTHGGLTSWTSFLFKALRDKSQYDPTIVSVATCRNDLASRRALKPSSWNNCPKVSTALYDGIKFPHVGAVLAEIEPARYRPHKVLNAILERSDIVLVVSGTPAWAYLAAQSRKPIILMTASFAARERQQRIQASEGFAGLWNQAMALIVSGMEPGALRLASKVFVLNRYAERRIAEIVGTSRVARAPIGVDVAAFYPADVYADDGYLLVVGRMNDPRKNIEFLLRTYASVRAKMPSPPTLVIAGEPPSLQLQRLVEANRLRDYVRFVHSPTREQLVDLYQKASLLLISSAEEGFGIVAVEAMACGIPVIATMCTGPEEVIVENTTGYLVPLEGDLFATRIMEALTDPAHRRLMAKMARSLAVERYSLAAASKPYLAVLHEL